MNLLFLLLACGTEAPLASPAPPPLPAPHFAKAQADKDVVLGLLSELHLPTRTWLLTAEGGGRIVCFLDDQGVVEVNGATKLLGDLSDGLVVTAEGKLDGTLLVVKRVIVGTAPAPVVPVASGAVGLVPSAATTGTSPSMTGAPPADAATGASTPAGTGTGTSGSTTGMETPSPATPPGNP